MLFWPLKKRHNLSFTFGLLTVCLFSHICQAHYPDGLYAEVTTNKGRIVIRLEFEKTPMTVASFVGLAEGTIQNAAFPAGRPYFDGTAWHRVVPGHVIQCGIPRSDKAKEPGYQFPNEICLPDLNHDRAGMVNMANGGPHTNASQWCIMLGDRSYLNGDYTVFGRVILGMDVVFQIVQGDEVQDVKIIRKGKAAEAFRPTTETFNALVDAARVRVKEAEERMRLAEADMIASRWPKAVPGENGLRYLIEKEGTGPAPGPGARVKVAYSGTTLYGKAFISTADGTPYWGQRPEPFVFEIGKTRIHPGLDATVSRMKKGEKRTVIIPSNQAYKTNGFYARERKGEKRFVVSPNAILVYQIESIDLMQNERNDP